MKFMTVLAKIIYEYIGRTNNIATKMLPICHHNVKSNCIDIEYKCLYFSGDKRKHDGVISVIGSTSFSWKPVGRSAVKHLSVVPLKDIFDYIEIQSRPFQLEPSRLLRRKRRRRKQRRKKISVSTSIHTITTRGRLYRKKKA